MLKIKRIYDGEASADGRRILVDRLWPRGIKKEAVRVDEWIKDIAPSTELRRWFAHDPSKWTEFKTRYCRELEAKKDLLDTLSRQASGRTVTLLYSARDVRHNNAAALRELLDGGKRRSLPA